MSETKCYRWKNHDQRDSWGVDRYRLDHTCGRWMRVLFDGKTETVASDSSMSEYLRSGQLIEVPDCPAHWPIIDGQPKNPAAFEALYRAEKKAIEACDDQDDTANLPCDVYTETHAALALADKGVES